MITTFKSIRIQMIYPCRARCSWCATHKKNKLFGQLYQQGVSARVHAFYLDTIRRLRPRRVFISGGEPLILPEIAQFIAAIEDFTEEINIFASYQWSRQTCEAIPFSELPQDKVIVCHTPLYFDPKKWDQLAGGFPYQVYRDNIRQVVALPLRKRFKFIINHQDLPDELRRFGVEIEPNQSCQLSFKVINDQGGGLCADNIERTKAQVKARVDKLDAVVREGGWTVSQRLPGSFELMRPLLDTGRVQQCPYRQKPLELRFALDRKARGGRPVLRYRYCPYFPPASGHRFHTESDHPEKLIENFEKGSLHRDCGGCRFLRYGPAPGLRSARPARRSIEAGG